MKSERSVLVAVNCDRDVRQAVDQSEHARWAQAPGRPSCRRRRGFIECSRCEKQDHRGNRHVDEEDPAHDTRSTVSLRERLRRRASHGG